MGRPEKGIGDTRHHGTKAPWLNQLGELQVQTGKWPQGAWNSEGRGGGGGDGGCGCGGWQGQGEALSWGWEGVVSLWHLPRERWMFSQCPRARWRTLEAESAGLRACWTGARSFPTGAGQRSTLPVYKAVAFEARRDLVISPKPRKTSNYAELKACRERSRTRMALCRACSQQWGTHRKSGVPLICKAFSGFILL